MIINFLREVINYINGDYAYQAYLNNIKNSNLQTQPISKKDFLRLKQKRKWLGINRCC